MNKKVFGLMALTLAAIAPAANAQSIVSVLNEATVTAEPAEPHQESVFSAGILVGTGSGVGVHSDYAGDLIYGGTKIAAVAQLKLGRWGRLAPEVGVNLTGPKTYFNADLNLHEVWHLNRTFNFAAPDVNLYTITGAGFQAWRGDDEPRNKTFKLNFGMGGDVTVYKHIKLTAEYRWDWAVLGYSSTTFSVGVQYAF